MAKNKVTVTDNSIRSGVTSDANKAICEYIWNGFDAHAKHVSIKYKTNEIGTILSLSIIDDGDGIKRSTLPETFGRYQDSVKKKSFQWSSQVKGHKGKGRYSFNCFATGAEWTTVFRDEEGRLLQHIISINGDDNDHYNDHSDEGDAKVVHDMNTGTVVNFLNVSLTSAFFESKDFISYLQKEFAVFLKLNENRAYTLTVNDVQIDCNAVIAEADTKEINLYDDKLKTNQHFSLTFIRWFEKMKENYSVYYLNEEGLERYEETTRLNKKDTGFHHSVYVSSSYFEYFAPTAKAGQESEDMVEMATQMLIEFDGHHVTKTEKDKVFKELRKRVAEWLTEKQKSFINEVGGKELWEKFESKGVVDLPLNEYDEPQFNSPDAQWTFILVGNKLDKSGFIKREIDNSKTWGKNNLIQHVDDSGQHYDIYVRTWGAIFEEFEIRHKFLLDKLNFKRKQLTAEYKDKQDLHQIVDNSAEK